MAEAHTPSPVPGQQPSLYAHTMGAVRCLTLAHRPTRNALVPALSERLIEEVLAAADQGLGAIVITGADGSFCSGGDVQALAGQQALPPGAQHQRLGVLNELVRTLRDSPLPVIAAVEGAAAGAGFSLMLACDLTVAAEDARFVMAYARLGLTPDGGGSFHLARALPPARAFAALALAEPLSAATLAQAGLVHAVVPSGQALTEGVALAQRLADGPRSALAGIKQLVQQAQLQPLAAQLELERALFVRELHGAYARAAVPAFLDRSPASGTPR
jgi:enoyl-CoA hydratase/carnithine racemase